MIAVHHVLVASCTQSSREICVCDAGTAPVLSRRRQLPQQTVQHGEYGLHLRVRDFRVEQLYGCGVHF
eukprot:COSAG02_NODE_312_length_24941_cov_60.672611_18_plen_68_part_00